MVENLFTGTKIYFSKPIHSSLDTFKNINVILVSVSPTICSFYWNWYVKYHFFFFYFENVPLVNKYALITCLDGNEINIIEIWNINVNRSKEWIIEKYKYKYLLNKCRHTYRIVSHDGKQICLLYYYYMSIFYNVLNRDNILLLRGFKFISLRLNVDGILPNVY